MVLQMQLGLVHFRSGNYNSAANCWTELAQSMDEEYELQLDILERTALRWANGMGQRTDRSGFARSYSNFMRRIYVFGHKIRSPKSWLGRQLWRFIWWAGRF